jgi:hypothetical protein
MRIALAILLAEYKQSFALDPKNTNAKMMIELLR